MACAAGPSPCPTLEWSPAPHRGRGATSRRSRALRLRRLSALLPQQRDPFRQDQGLLLSGLLTCVLSRFMVRGWRGKHTLRHSLPLLFRQNFRTSSSTRTSLPPPERPYSPVASLVQPYSSGHRSPRARLQPIANPGPEFFLGNRAGHQAHMPGIQDEELLIFASYEVHRGFRLG